MKGIKSTLKAISAISVIAAAVAAADKIKSRITEYAEEATENEAFRRKFDVKYVFTNMFAKGACCEVSGKIIMPRAMLKEILKVNGVDIDEIPIESVYTSKYTQNRIFVLNDHSKVVHTDPSCNHIRSLRYPHKTFSTVIPENYKICPDCFLDIAKSYIDSNNTEGKDD